MKSRLELINENRKIKEENEMVRSEALELSHTLNNIRRIVDNGDRKKENFFIMLDKIKKELDVGQTY